ncbi:MAG: hypothetical protein IJT83_14240 [Victivallales bacterium]|nr:hypothetical protein [Victivallales bacterium]
MKNLPLRIYLNFGEIDEEDYENGDFDEIKNLDENAVTWCEDKVFDTDEEYLNIALVNKIVRDAVENAKGNKWQLLREKYAGMMIQGIMANHGLSLAKDNRDMLCKGIALFAIEMADALIAELKKE